MSEELSKSFISYYSNLSNKEFSLLSFERVFGGASRETYKIRLKDSLGSEERLILRLSQESSLIETEQRIEYLAYSAFQKSNVPVPILIDMSEEDSTFNAPFMLMRELNGEAANPFIPNGYSPYEQDIGIQFWSILGEIAKRKLDNEIFNTFAKDLDKPFWKTELDKWVKVIDEDSIGVEPILDAGIRYLYSYPPKAVSYTHLTLPTKRIV